LEEFLHLGRPFPGGEGRIAGLAGDMPVDVGRQARDQRGNVDTPKGGIKALNEGNIGVAHGTTLLMAGVTRPVWSGCPAHRHVKTTLLRMPCSANRRPLLRGHALIGESGSGTASSARAADW